MRLLALSALFVFAASPATAGGGGMTDSHAVVQHIFTSADADQNGQLTQAEYEDAGLQRFGVSFEASDLDGSGETSLDEYLELYERHHPSPDRGDA